MRHIIISLGGRGYLLRRPQQFAEARIGRQSCSIDGQRIRVSGIAHVLMVQSFVNITIIFPFGLSCLSNEIPCDTVQCAICA